MSVITIDWCCVFFAEQAKQPETVRVMCMFKSSTVLSQDGYTDFEQTGRAEQGPSPPSMVHPGSDAADEMTHTTERPSLSCWTAVGWTASVDRRHQYTQTHGSEAVQCRTYNRSQHYACHRRRDAAAARVTQLDRSGLLYTGRGSVPRLTLAGHRTGRPLEAIMLIHSEQTAIDRWDTKRTNSAPCRWRHATPRDDAEASCGRLSWKRRTDQVTLASQGRPYPPLPECPPVPSEPPCLSSGELCIGTLKPMGSSFDDLR